MAAPQLDRTPSPPFILSSEKVHLYLLPIEPNQTPIEGIAYRLRVALYRVRQSLDFDSCRFVNPSPECPGWVCAVVRRRFSSGCKSHPAIAPAGSNRSSHGGDEMAEAFGIACHELVSLDFRCGSQAVIRRHHQEGLLPKVKQTQTARKRTWSLDVGCWGVERTYRRHGRIVRL